MITRLCKIHLLRRDGLGGEVVVVENKGKSQTNNKQRQYEPLRSGVAVLCYALPI
jgi:hypothetical protein